MSRLTDLDSKALTRWSGWSSNPRRVAWARKYGWTLFLLLAVVTLVYAVAFGSSHSGLSDPIGYAEAGVFFAVSAWLFFRRNRS